MKPSAVSIIRQLLLLSLTLLIITQVSNSLTALIVLLIVWGLSYLPLEKDEAVAGLIAAVFFLFQNYAVLSSGGFSFKTQDIFLMPYYEPFLWGFYYLNIRRFFSEDSRALPQFNFKSLAGLLATGAAFSLFPHNSSALLVASSISTTVLVILFHKPMDIAYGAYALAIGLAIELTGVTSGLWSYPDPDVLGIPYWFATMWVSVGILGRRFLFPLAQWLVEKLYTGKTD